MNIVIIQKPAPHCPIPFGHPLFNGFVPANETNIRHTWARSALAYGDDYDLTDNLGYLETPGAFK